MRRVLINAGFGEPISEEDRAWIRERGFDGVRSDYGTGVLDALFYTIFQPLIIASGPRQSPEFIINRVARICREAKNLGYLHNRSYPMPAIEPINEPDLDPYWSSRPAELSDVIWECWRIAARYSKGITIISPGISNLTQKALGYLGAMIDGGIPNEVAIGFHRYPPNRDPTEPHDGFVDRWDEVALLRSFAAGRKLWCTETGYTAGPYKKRRGFPLCPFTRNWFLTQEQVADRVVTEFRFWARVPDLEGAVLYQINDGENRNDREDNFGLRTYPNRKNKLLAEMMPRLIEEVTNEET